MARIDQDALDARSITLRVRWRRYDELFIRGDAELEECLAAYQDWLDAEERRRGGEETLDL